ncbi:MAG: SusC/RagA family TonB-linked outer membrane protein, partial [Bacteroidales bacterium]|nr:SusC/RagA family TonB-linked outer membrane protein [Bacteroidales bacterium]
MKKTLFALLIFSQILSAQSAWNITGQLMEEGSTEPVIGATIMIQETKEGTISDLDGNFSLQVPINATLLIQMIGYTTTTYKVSSNHEVIKLNIAPDAYILDEFVSVGYGMMKKSDLTGAVASIKSEDLQKTPAAGLDQALQGKVAGVTVNAGSGQPGQAAVVRIRGIGTVNGAGPIYVVDGMILDDISFLSPNDIASTEVLKDASSTAIYGSRGANGVILVTTKKGGQGKAKVSVNSYVGVQNRWNDLDLMQRDEFAETIQRINPSASSMAKYQENGFNAWMYDNVGTSPYYPILKTASNPYGMDYAAVETDWQDEVFKDNAIIQDHYISISGGDKESSYVMSASYFSQDGTVIGSDYERLTLRANTSMQVNRWLKIGENLSFVNSTGRNAMNNSSSPGASILSAAIAMAPWDPTHYPDGSINNQGKDLSGQISAASNFKNVTNPFSMVEHSYPENKVERWVGDLYIELSPFKHFTWRSTVSMDLANNRNKSFYETYEYSTYDKRNKNFLTSSMDHYRTIIVSNIANYSFDVNKHSFNLMAGQTSEQAEYYGLGGSGASILNPTKANWYLSKTTEDKSESSDDVWRTRMFSLLSRVHYSYDDRYMITANFRADASSKFPENLWGYFPSTAVAWRMSEEEWMKDFSSLDFLKLRLGWGQIGNDKIGSDNFITTMTESNNVFAGYPMGANQELANGAAVLTYANKGGKWETTEQLSAGVDFGFRQGLINGSVDGFIRDTKDMLIGVKAPAHVGNRYDPLSNVGTVRNAGIEISLAHQKKVGEINYNINGNISFIKNELTALNGGSPVYGDRTLSNEGLALYTLWGYQYESVYRSDQEAQDHLWSYAPEEIGVHAGDARYKDLSGPNGAPDG